MSNVQIIEVSSEEDGQRLDNFLLRILKGVPKSHIYRIIRSGEVRVNKGRAKPLRKVFSGDKIRIPPLRLSEIKEDLKISSTLEEQLKAKIIYEDEKLLVINKPSGIAVHGGSGLSLGIIEALRKIREDLPYLELVHRLDKETSGCLLIAKKRSVLRQIQALLAQRKVTKTYFALLHNNWQEARNININVPLHKNILKSGERMVIVSEDGKPSETMFKLVEKFNDFCMVEATPKTGRTHQIRVHSAYIKHPIVGDIKYGGNNVDMLKNRMYLHAHAISFILNEKAYTFKADIDDKFHDALNTLRKERRF